MKHLKWAAGLLLLAVVPVLAWAHIASAQRFSNTVDEGQTVNSSLYSAGQNVDVNGTINGDVFCAGQTITIDATVHGDVICAGQDVTVSGKVDGNIRIAGQTVSVNAVVSKNATIAAMTLSLDADASVGQDLTAMGDTLNIKGPVKRDVVANGNSVILNGNIGRNAKVSTAQLRLKSHALVAGNLHYTSNRKLDRDGGAKVLGSISQAKPAKSTNNQGMFRRFSIGFYLFMLVGLGLIALTLAYLFPQFLRRNSRLIKDNFTKTFIVGLVASLIVPMIALGLVLTVVGIPLVVLLLVAWLLGAFLTGPIAAYYIGQMVLRTRSNPMAITAVGSVILVTAYYLPLAGILVMMLAYWVGFGALLLSLKDHLRPAAVEEIAEKPAKPAKKPKASKK